MSGAVAAAGAASRHTLKGKTQQSYPIKVAVKRGAVDLLHFKADLRCRHGSILQLDESGFMPTRTHRNGSFKDVQYGSTDTVYLRGKFQGKRVRGRVRVEDKLGNGVRCRSGWIRFNAGPR